MEMRGSLLTCTQMSSLLFGCLVLRLVVIVGKPVHLATIFAVPPGSSFLPHKARLFLLCMGRDQNT